MRLKSLVGLLFFWCMLAYSQLPDLTPLSKISVLTCGPGEELYSSFGHSAFRVQDDSLGIDIVYNYGVFDDTSSGFYFKFVQGQMDYKLVRNRFNGFLNSYKVDNRWVTEQDLNLTLNERNTVLNFLENNAKPENRVYPYDFFFNNCSTKIWHVLEESLGEKLVFNKSYLKEHFTFRQLIHQNLKTNSWSAFGIDLALGSVIDRKASAQEHIYLPSYMMQQLQTTEFATRKLAPVAQSLFTSMSTNNSSSLLLSPFVCLLLILILVIVITYLDYKKKKRSKWLDFTLFFITGLAGLLLIFLWLLTDHSQTINNFNVLWVFPLNSIASFVLIKKEIPNWINKYVWILLVAIACILPVWLFNIQIFSPLIILLLLALVIRYLFLQYYFKLQTQNK